MMRPVLDSRDADAVRADLLGHLATYLPGWQPPATGAGRALLEGMVRYMTALIERLNEVPDKNLLAFLDLLGQSLLSAQAARAPVVFTFTPPAPPLVPPALTSPPGLALALSETL